MFNNLVDPLLLLSSLTLQVDGASELTAFLEGLSDSRVNHLSFYSVVIINFRVGSEPKCLIHMSIVLCILYVNLITCVSAFFLKSKNKQLG